MSVRRTQCTLSGPGGRATYEIRPPTSASAEKANKVAYRQAYRQAKGPSAAQKKKQGTRMRMDAMRLESPGTRGKKRASAQRRADAVVGDIMQRTPSFVVPRTYTPSPLRTYSSGVFMGHPQTRPVPKKKAGKKSRKVGEVWKTKGMYWQKRAAGPPLRLSNEEGKRKLGR